MLELCDTGEVLEGMLPISFKIIDLYQREDPFLTENLKCAEYQKVSFCEYRNTIELVT